MSEISPEVQAERLPKHRADGPVEPLPAPTEPQLQAENKKPEDQKESKEEKTKPEVTPNVARILAGTVDPRFLTGGEKMTPENIETFKARTSEDLYFKPLERLSLESRRKQLENSKESLEENNKNWNNELFSYIKIYGWIRPEGRSEEQQDERTKALNSLGLDISHDKVGADGLHSSVETFRKRYLDKGSNIKGFVEDLAKGCSKDGEVDLELLQKRLESIEGIFGVFGVEEGIDGLVKDYTVAHALLTQKDPDVKERLANEVSANLAFAIPEGKKSVFEKLLPVLGTSNVEKGKGEEKKTFDKWLKEEGFNNLLIEGSEVIDRNNLPEDWKKPLTLQEMKAKLKQYKVVPKQILHGVKTKLKHNS